MAKTNQSRSQRQSQRQNRRSQRKSQRQNRRSQRQSQRQNRRSQRQQKRSQRQSQRRSKKRPMNAFMQKLNTARNSKAQSFEYNGKLYNRKVLNTGMAVYKSA